MKRTRQARSGVMFVRCGRTMKIRPAGYSPESGGSLTPGGEVLTV